jgi:WhiB family transcriptional regulator, redox-sensing transcriptional regulator
MSLPGTSAPAPTSVSYFSATITTGGWRNAAAADRKWDATWRYEPFAERDDQEELGHMWITDWTARAACKGTDPDELFVQGAAQNRAKLICRGCPVRTECLADALDNRIEFGVWGGMTERERRALLRRRPDVVSWRDLLENARNHYERSGDELVAS